MQQQVGPYIKQLLMTTNGIATRSDYLVAALLWAVIASFLFYVGIWIVQTFVSIPELVVPDDQVDLTGMVYALMLLWGAWIVWSCGMIAPTIKRIRAIGAHRYRIGARIVSCIIPYCGLITVPVLLLWPSKSGHL